MMLGPVSNQFQKYNVKQSSAAVAAVSPNLDVSDFQIVAAQVNWGCGSNANGDVGSPATGGYAALNGSVDGNWWTLVSCQGFGAAALPSSGSVSLIGGGQGLFPYPLAQLAIAVGSGQLTTSAAVWNRAYHGRAV
jgi:hypothetical protein